ncbi:MAG: flagellar basal body L-ring protein FlgH [Campylobacterota bacterium]|nr:flagellar basal body L-ring protein FlgH [Campylobacterota bacterium]
MLKYILILLMPLCVMLFFTGCTAGLNDPEIDFEPPVYVEQMPAREDKKDYTASGSIFGKGDNPLFSDHKAMHVNDIVQVLISESTQSSNTAAKSITAADDSDLGGGTFVADGANSAISGLANNLNGVSNIGFTTKSNSSFKGQGSSTKDASFNTIVSVRIVKVLENGNYFISGSREILIDDQKQVIQISGVIRPYDIDQYNKIDSSQMSEAKILYKTEGDVDRATKQGWGTKAIQAIWPF